MAQIINDPYVGNIFGRLGKGVGQGLSEQIPKEIERARLSHGLKEIGQNKKLTPLERATQLYGLPGGAEIAPTILPLLREQQQREAYQSRTGGGQTVPTARNVAPTGAAPISPIENAPMQEKPNKGGLVSRTEIERNKSNLLQPYTQEDIDRVANDILGSNMTQDPQQARAIATQELDQNLKAQEEKISNLQNTFGQEFGLLLNSHFGEGNKVATEIQKDLVDQARYLVTEKGMTPREASDKLSTVAQDLGKTYTQLQETGGGWFSNVNAKNKVRSLKQQEDMFKKYGYGEIFNNLAANSLGVSPQAIASVLEPIKNESIIKEIDKIPRKARGKVPKESDYDALVNSITPKDNILAIEKYLLDKNLNPSIFLSRLGELRRDEMTERQVRDMQKPISSTRFGDILFDIFK